MMAIDPKLLAQAKAFLEDDPDETTRAELRDLLSRGNGEELAERFSGPLEFGTAGLRGLVGAGESRMNRAVVARATAGLCRWVLEQVPGAEQKGICIGFDGRHMSRQFAEDAASIVAGMGMPAKVFTHTVPTPLVAFAVKDQAAAAGIMITASHNPPAYNGYKVYWCNGAQIIPPHDRGIAERIAAVASVREIPRLGPAEARSRGLYQVLGQELISRYFAGVADLAVHRTGGRDLTIAYTALHGVGDPFTRKALAQAGFERVHSVPEQAQPDGDFPTVSFPNPEEEGAMDLVLALAEAHRADLVLANDPDADRLAAAVRDASGRYVQLTGNEVGCLLAHYLLDQGSSAARPLVVSSVVSSPMLGVIAAAHGAHWEQTLTGFKWITNRAMEIEAEQALSFVFGYEEALGYSVGPLVRDKDGVSAAMLLAEMAAWCRSRGSDLLEERDVMWRRYGLFMSRQISTTFAGTDGKRRMDDIMERLRQSPPSQVASTPVVAHEDLLTGKRTSANGPAGASALRGSNVMLFELDGGHRIMVRPSGTEPKVKVYVDVRVEVISGEATADAQARGREIMDRLATAFVERAL